MITKLMSECSWLVQVQYLYFWVLLVQCKEINKVCIIMFIE